METLIFRARRALAAGLEEAAAPGVWRKRLRRGADAGGALALVKAMLGGGGAAAVKVAALVALAGAAVATTAAGHSRPQHGTPAPAKAPARANDARPAPVTSTPAPTQFVSAALHPDAAPHPTPAKSPPLPAQSKPAPTTAPAPPAEQAPAPAPPESTPTPTLVTPAVVQPQAPPMPAASRPKGQAKHARRPESAPKQTVAHGNPHAGGDQGQPEASPPAPDPAATATTAPGNSGDHGQSAAPGQQDKGDPGGHGNGRGK